MTEDTATPNENLQKASLIAQKMRDEIGKAVIGQQAVVEEVLIALFAGWVLNSKAVDEEFAGDTSVWKSYWRIANRYLAPVVLIVVFVNLVIGWDRILQAF